MAGKPFCFVGLCSRLVTACGYNDHAVAPHRPPFPNGTRQRELGSDCFATVKPLPACRSRPISKTANVVDRGLVPAYLSSANVVLRSRSITNGSTIYLPASSFMPASSGCFRLICSRSGCWKKSCSGTGVFGPICTLLKNAGFSR